MSTSAANKYRVHELAKDFGLGNKDVSEILAKYATAPKNHMQALTDEELSLVFEYLTQHNQISSIQEIFADTYQEPKEAPAAPAAAKPAAPAQSQAQQPFCRRQCIFREDR